MNSDATTGAVSAAADMRAPDPTPFNASPVRGQLFAALAKAQKAFPVIPKDKSANIQTRGGSAYSYDYADLASVLDAIRTPLADNGLCVFQPVCTLADGRVSVQTVVAHESDQWLATDAMVMPVADRNDPRAIASAITYARRYQLQAALGLAPEADDDGEAAGKRPARGGTDKRERREAAPEAPTGGAASDDDRAITKPQLDRLKAIMAEHKVDERTFGAYLKETYGYQRWRDVKRNHYDAIVTLAQAGGAKPPVDETASA